MKQQGTKRKTTRAEAIAGATLVLLLVAGATAWAAKGDGKIQLKKDATALEQRAQTRQRLDPFRDMLQMQREMERLFNDTLNPYSGFPGFEATFEQEFQQAMDLRETADAFVVQMDLPGLEKSDISIEVKDHVLIVSGERKQAKEEKKDEKVIMQERSVSSFSREVVLPKSVDADAAMAEYKAGVLTITLPKTGKDKEIRKIKIK